MSTLGYALLVLTNSRRLKGFLRMHRCGYYLIAFVCKKYGEA